MGKIILEASKRDVFGRKVKVLRSQGMLPANVYGKKVKSLALAVLANDFLKAFKEAGATNLIELKVKSEDKSRQVLATNLQKDPVTDQPIHIDFHQVDLTVKVVVAVPIEVHGEAPAVKEKGAVLIRLLDEVEVEALPQDLPDRIDVDVSGLTEFDDSIQIKDLKVSEKVTLKAPAEEAVVMVQEPKKEEEVAPTAETPAEAGQEEQPEAEAGQPQPQEGEASEKTKDEKEK